MKFLRYTCLLTSVLWLGLFCIFSYTDALYCYSCGNGYHENPCVDFRAAAHWDPFVIDCGQDTLCVKTLTLDKKESRSCTPQRSAMGQSHKTGCFGHSKSGMLFCFCNVNYCNGQSSLSSNAHGWIAALCVIIVFVQTSYLYSMSDI